MVASLEYKNILSSGGAYLLVDVRSPREYAQSTIPGSVNIPLFSDCEYEKIGICYKENGKEAAVSLGLQFVSPKLETMYKDFIDLRREYKKIALFCARGGMRSTTVGSFLQSLGLSVVKVDKGYKGYRQFLNDALPEAVSRFTFISIYGKTGSGKTLILDEIRKLGYPVLDLEKHANHRGSLLGSIGLGECNSQKTFESLVFQSLYEAEGEYIFTEGESKRIGKIIMPDYMYNAVAGGKRLLINTEIDKRIKIIRNEYINENTDPDEIYAAIQSMGAYIGKERTEEYISSLKTGDYDGVINSLMTKYYDSAYSTKYKDFLCVFENLDEHETAKAIIKYTKDNIITT